MRHNFRIIQSKEGEIVGKNHRIGFAAGGHEIYLYNKE